MRRRHKLRAWRRRCRSGCVAAGTAAWFRCPLGGLLVCLCSRLTLADGRTAILVVAVDRAGQTLALPDRARRILLDLDKPAAIFTADGELIDCTTSARDYLASKRDLVALGAETLAREATLNGQAQGEINGGGIALRKLGAGTTDTLLMIFTSAPSASVPTPVTETASIVSPPMVPNPAAAEPAARRLPFRFVWQMDEALRFTAGTDDFARLIGPNTASVLDRPWHEIADAFKLDPSGQIAQALASRGTWSGIVVMWPVDGSEDRLPIEMSGLPVFDRDRRFAGFRGFGICRDMERLEAIQRERMQPSPPIAPPAPQAAPAEPEATVLPFPTGPVEPPPLPPTTPALSPGEQSAFQELARELSEQAAPWPQGSPAATDVCRTVAAASAKTAAQRQRRARRPGGPADSRPAAGRHSGLSAQHPDLRQPRLPRVDRLRHPRHADARPAASTACSSRAKEASAERRNGGKTLTITTVNGKQKPVEGRLFSVTWNNENALVLMINTQPAVADERGKTAEAALRRLRRGKPRAQVDSRYRHRRRAGARSRRPRALGQPQRRGAVRL